MRRAGLNRRRLLALATAAVPLALWPGRAFTATASLDEGLLESSLIYLTPLHGDGRESSCQAEIWFVAEGRDAWVVTASGSWRARAVDRGLDRARVWVGDVGVWTRSNGAYRNLPAAEADVARVDDPLVHARVLELFGAKYRMSWILWGPRFRRGLADGSRVLLRYRLSSSHRSSRRARVASKPRQPSVTL
jgi:hypothetical protein